MRKSDCGVRSGNDRTMEIGEIISALEYHTGKFPRVAVEEAIEKKDQIIPELLKALEKARHDGGRSILADEHYYLHMYAVHLLAQFREKRAYPLVVGLVSQPGEVPFDLFGDLITEDLGRILASLSCGDSSLIKGLIEDSDLNEYVRSAALEALLVLVACGEKRRDEIVAYFKELFHGKLEREYSYVWSKLIDCCYYIHPEELYDEVKEAYREGLVEGFSASPEDIEEALQRPKERTVERLKNDERFELTTDTVASFGSWACFHTADHGAKKSYSAKQLKRLLKSLPTDNSPSDSAPVVRSKKIGRNEPCPCGSGKKYKYCCGR